MVNSLDQGGASRKETCVVLMLMGLLIGAQPTHDLCTSWSCQRCGSDEAPFFSTCATQFAHPVGLYSCHTRLVFPHRAKVSRKPARSTPGIRAY